MCCSSARIRAARCAVVAALALAAARAGAQPGPGPAADGGLLWALGLGAQVDDDSNRSLLAHLDLLFDERTALSFTAGRSRSPSDRADVAADIAGIALDHRFGRIGTALTLERWGESGSVESRDRALELYWDAPAFRIGVEREHRDIDIGFSFTGPLGVERSGEAPVDADGTRVALSVELGEAWRAYLSAARIDYSRDLAVLPRIARLNLLSTSTLTLAQSLIDRDTVVGAERLIGRRALNLTWARDRSGVDGSEVESLSGAYLFGAGARVDLELNVGVSDSDLLGSSVFGGVLVLFYGGGR